ncbi:unnamed protein product [Camellia sinensis]
MDIDSVEAASSTMQMDSEESSNASGKEKDAIAKSIEKMKIESGEAGTSSTNFKKKPVIIIVVGMAGSGKTTFLHRLVCHTQASNIRGYVMNLDPAVASNIHHLKQCHRLCGLLRIPKSHRCNSTIKSPLQLPAVTEYCPALRQQRGPQSPLRRGRLDRRA